MKDRDQSRLASILALLVGIWVLISPTWVGVSGAALTSTIIVGIVMIIASVVQIFFTRNTVPSWIVGIAAVWLLISAFTYGVTAGAMTSQIISAVLAFIFAYWDGAEVTEMHSSRHMTT